MTDIFPAITPLPIARPTISSHLAPRRPGPIGSIALIAMGSALAAAMAHAAPRAVDPYAQFASPGRLVDMGARRLNLHCSGAGSPTVIFNAPLGTSGASWFQVHPTIARLTRACVYDRAGLGLSDPSSLPGTIDNATDDLQRLLETAGIAPPYIMVGNSYDGGIAQVFAYRYPAAVQGLVLVEPYHEDQFTRAAAATGGKSELMRAMGRQVEKECAQQATLGLVPGTGPFQRCTGGIDPKLGRSLAAAHLAREMSATQWQARLSEDSNLDTSAAQLRALRRPFGELPLTVLSRTISPYAIPGKPQSAVNKAFEEANLSLNRDMAALSTRGKLKVVPKAGHIIQYDQPDAVIAAITDMLAGLPK